MIMLFGLCCDLIICRLEILNIKTNRGRAKLLGTLVCISGAVILILYKGKPLVAYSHPEAPPPTMDQAISLSSGKKAERWTIGSVALMAGTILWSSWFLIQSNIGKLYPCQYSSTAIMSFFGAIQSAVITLSMDRNPSLWILKGKIEILTVIYAVSMLSLTNIVVTFFLPRFIFSLYIMPLIIAVFSMWMQGMIGSGLCYVAMSWCVKKRGPVFTAAFSPLVQIMAVMFDIPVLHEQLHLGR